jgi:hypothetical protein
LPDELDDRAQDIWEPLLAIADLAGGDWPEIARKAAVELSTGAEREDESIGARLLRDIFTVFTEGTPQRYKTADLISELVLIEESPWGDWKGKPITSQALSNLLKPYRIRTMPVWVDEKTVKGYKAEQFTDVWRRVLGDTEVRRVSGVRSGSLSQNDLTVPNPHAETGLGAVRSDPSVHAGSNPPNPPNPQGAGNGGQGVDLDEIDDPVEAERVAAIFAREKVTAGSHLPNAEVRRLLETYRPELLGRDDLLTKSERREVANTLALYEAAYGQPGAEEVAA